MAVAIEGAPPAYKVEALLLPKEADAHACEADTADLESEWRVGTWVGRASADAFDEVGTETVEADVDASTQEADALLDLFRSVGGGRAGTVQTTSASTSAQNHKENGKNAAHN